MSTKSTIYERSGDGISIHLYQEMLDDTIRLEICQGAFSLDIELDQDLLNGCKKALTWMLTTKSNEE